MLDTDVIFYNALKSSPEIMELTSGRIFPTCIEVPPTEEDNTPLPYIIVMYDNMRNMQQHKDDYEGEEDSVSISVEISAKSRKAVGQLAKLVRAAVHDYFTELEEGAEDYDLLPDDYELSASGVAWDWMKPCYFQTLSYQCSTLNDNEV